MHKGVIMLVKATTAEEAQTKLDSWMEPFGDGDVWDWWSIGGRWHNALAPKDKVKEFTDWVEEKYPIVKGGYPIDKIENDEVRPIIQAKWESLGLIGKNPFYDSYGFTVRKEDQSCNIVRLSECQEVVKDWLLDVEKEKDAAFEKMVEYRNEEKEKSSGHGTMSGYMAGIYKKLSYGEFSFECNVFNTELGEAEKLPDNIDGYFAIIIDMHN